MNKFSIGDIVTIKDSGELYSTYKDWLTNFAPEYLPLWKYGAQFPFTREKLYFRIVAMHPHEDKGISDVNLCLIQAADEQVYLISEKGLNLAQNQENTFFQVSSGVKVVDNQFCYTDYQDWLEENAPVFLSRYKKSKVPENGEEYVVVFRAPKGTVAPFCTEQLFVISNNLTDSPVYIMDKYGMVPVNENVKSDRKIELFDNMLAWIFNHTTNQEAEEYVNALKQIGFTEEETKEEMNNIVF